MSNQYENMTDEQLAAHASGGLSGQGAIVESMRRMKEAIVAEDLAIKTMSIWLVRLTIVLVVETAVIAFFAAVALWGSHAAR